MRENMKWIIATTILVLVLIISVVFIVKANTKKVVETIVEEPYEYFTYWKQLCSRCNKISSSDSKKRWR